MPEDITLTIDGVEVTTQPGKMIIQAAMEAGMYIPYLCYYPGMKPFGACRMCVVKAEQRTPDGEYRALPGSPASCTTPVADGMRVDTNSEGLVDLRRGIMDLLISEHPHGCLTCHRIELCGPADVCLRHVSVNDRCVTCPKNERCELKDTVRFLEMDLDTPLTYNNRHMPLQVADPYWDMDMNLCIVCARCVRACDEIRGDQAITLVERSGRTLIGTSRGTSLLESGCEFCGACIDVCPTGALVERENKWGKAATTITSTCPHCPVGCQMTLEVDKRNRVIRSIPDLGADANHGQACFKGKFGMGFVNDARRRIKTPLVRRDGSLEEASWHDALDAAAEGLAPHKGGQFALVASSRGTNEDNYLAQKFARTVMGSNSVDVSSNTRPELTETLGELLGVHAATNSIWELEASQCFLVVSSNMTEEQNVAAVPIKKAVKEGASLIVIDQRETELTRFASVWMRPKPGTETALIGGMLRVILDESLDDHEFLADYCHGLDDFRNHVWAFDLVRVERITGVPHAQIQDAARRFASRKPGAILYALETLPPELRADCVHALVDLALVSGNLGRPSTGLFPLFTGANEQGSKDVGCTPTYLPGYVPASDLSARTRLAGTWGTDLPSSTGVGIRGLAAAIASGAIKALYVAGDSPSFANGELDDLVEALSGLDFLVVQDTFPSRLTEAAHVVLPSATFAEREGTYTNMERRVHLLSPAVGPKGDEDVGWHIIAQLAQRMGAQGFSHVSSEEVFDEINNQVEPYGGITYSRLRAGGLQWPCPAADMTDTQVLYAGGFAAGHVGLSDLNLADPPARDDPSYPLLLARGRVLHQPDRPVDIEMADGRNFVTRSEIIEVHAEDAEELGIAEGDGVEVVFQGGSIAGVARLSSPHKGLVATTSLFGEMITGVEQSDATDPMLGIPGLPLLPARVEKAAVQAAAD